MKNPRSTHKAVLFGAGGFADVWVNYLIPPFKGRLEIVGLVDFNEEILNAQAEKLNLSENQRFSAISSAFDAIDAGEISPDLCIVVVPPAIHEQVVTAACERQLDVLCEKPISDSWDACVRVWNLVAAAGVRMQVIQNYRYSRSAMAMKKLLKRNELGELNYIHARFSADYREYASWGSPFRHNIQHPLLLEAGIHHLDQLRNLSGSDVKWVSGKDWLPIVNARDYKGECCGLFVGEMVNGVKFSYEGTVVTAGTEHSWEYEIYRAECERGTIVIQSPDEIEIIVNGDKSKLDAQSVLGAPTEWTLHLANVARFLDWMDGGDPPETIVSDNIKSCAAVFGSMLASDLGKVVKIDVFGSPTFSDESGNALSFIAP